MLQIVTKRSLCFQAAVIRRLPFCGFPISNTNPNMPRHRATVFFVVWIFPEMHLNCTTRNDMLRFASRCNQSQCAATLVRYMGQSLRHNDHMSRLWWRITKLQVDGTEIYWGFRNGRRHMETQLLCFGPTDILYSWLVSMTWSLILILLLLVALVAFSVTPNSKYTFDGWSENGGYGMASSNLYSNIFEEYKIISSQASPQISGNWLSQISKLSPLHLLQLKTTTVHTLWLCSMH